MRYDCIFLAIDNTQFPYRFYSLSFFILSLQIYWVYEWYHRSGMMIGRRSQSLRIGGGSQQEA
jgi:hypothetical protein